MPRLNSITYLQEVPLFRQFPWPHRCGCCFALTPYLTDHLRLHARSARVRESLTRMHKGARQQRLLRSAMLSLRWRATDAPPAPLLERLVFDCGMTPDLLRRLARKEGGRKTGDVATDEAYDYSGVTFRFFAEVFNRASIDN